MTQNSPSAYEIAYLDTLREIVGSGTDRGDRTGTGCRSVFVRTLRQDLAEGFPLLTTKKVFVRGIAEELAWFLRGETNIQPLVQKKVSIWSDWPHARYVQETGEQIDLKTFEQRIAEDDAFAAEWGDLGPVYGKQWRAWTGPRGPIDQLRETLERARTKPTDRRLIVSAWNPGEIPDMALPPCHCFFQLHAADGRLSLMLVQRSCDMFLGVPFNVASYAILTHLIARELDLPVGEFSHVLADAHIYSNHFDQVDTQLARDPRPAPNLVLSDACTGIDNFDAAHVGIHDYDPHPAIKAPVAV